MKKYILLIMVIGMLSGCGPWAATRGVYKGSGFAVDLPQGWMRSRQAEDLLITRDGLLLQSMAVFRSEVEAPFRYTKKRLTKGMMPQEAAEVILDNIASNEKNQKFQVLENKPVKLNGTPGFKTVFTYQDGDGLKYKSVYYGAIRDEHFYGIRYTAPARHYFEQDVKSFEKLAASFKFR